jgi:hypothetical protein
MWIKQTIYFSYSLLLTACAGVGAAHMLGGGKWAALVGLVAGVLVMAEIGRGFSMILFLNDLTRRPESML